MSATVIDSAPNLNQPTPVCVHLKNIIDLALGTPEVGVVNFNLVHSILHVIVSKLNLQDVKVEIRGEEAAALRCLIETGQVSPSVQVSEYVIETVDGKQQAKSSEKVTVVQKIHEDGSDGSRRLSVATSSQYNMLDKKVSTLEQRVLDVTQKNSDILKKSKTGSKSVSEMWQMMNLMARLDATENGVGRVSSLIEDLAMEVNKISLRLGYSGIQLGDFAAKDPGAGGKDRDGEDGEDGEDGGKQGGENDLKKSRSVMAMIDELLGDMGVLKEEVKNLNENFEGFKSGGLDGDGCGGSDEKFCEMNQAIVRIDNAFNSQMNYYQDKLTDVENEVLNMMQCMQETRSLSGQVATLEEYSTKLQAMLEDIQTISSKTNILFDEKEERAKEIELIQEELECLKHYKADRRDVEEALDEKADVKVVNKKVSVDQFSCAFKNVCESLNELYTKMTNQEITWRNALDDIMRDLEKKIERNEAISMNEEIYDKVKKLHERLKILETAKKEAEAAGSKAKYLRNVNCISCDNRVIMPKTEAGASTFKSWPQKGNAVPYACYDVEFLKKNQKKVCACGQEGCGGNRQCNRYCGGSHTKITQEQRMKQKGNIVNQYNVIEVQSSEPAETVIKAKTPATQDQGVMANLGGDTGREVIMPPKKFFDCSEYIFGDVGQDKPAPTKLSARDDCGDKRGSTKRPSTEKAPSAHSITSKRRSIAPSKSHESGGGISKQSEKISSKQSIGSKISSGKRISADKTSQKSKSPSIKKSVSEQVVVEAPPSKQPSGDRVSAKSQDKVPSKQPSASSKRTSEAKVSSKQPSAEKVAEEAEPAAEEPEAADSQPAEEQAEEPLAEEAAEEPAPEE